MSLLIHGDALDVLRGMPSESANIIPTSPPYWQQRDYEADGQIGRERTVGEYLDRLFPVFDQAWRVLKPDGTCWVNLGDTSVKKCLQLVPWRFAAGMVERGWILRQVIIWHKKNPKPESVKSRFTNAWEPIFFFAKNEQHFFSRQFEPCCKATMKRCEAFVKRGEKFDPARHKHDPLNVRQAPMRILERVAKTWSSRARPRTGCTSRGPEETTGTCLTTGAAICVRCGDWRSPSSGRSILPCGRRKWSGG